VRGVIAPEAANNAVRGGDLVPTLFFGIPGSGSMALLLGAFILIGIQPGARMISSDLDLTFVMIWSLALANIFGAVLCIGLAGPIAKLTLVRYAYLAPLIIVLLYFTAYQATRSWGDVLALLVISVIGVYLKQFDWPRPALLVGFVLSSGLESSIYQTAQVYGLTFLYRPQSVLIALLVLASAGFGVHLILKNRRQAGEAIETFVGSKIPQLVFTCLLVAAVGYAVLSGLQLIYLSRLFPVSVAAVTLALLVAILIAQVMAGPTSPVLADADQAEPADVAAARPSKFLYLGWFALFLLVIAVFGFSIGATLFVIAFITVECGGSIRRNLLFGAATVVVLTLLAYFLYLEYPRGLLPDRLGLPWWLH
jgi:hypothetical protein